MNLRSNSWAATCALSVFLCLAPSARPQTEDSQLPDGPGKQIVQNACTQCHEIEMVTTQNFTKEEWSHTVDLMVSRGARLNQDQIATVVAYLAGNFGKSNASESAVPTSSPASSVPSSTAPPASENRSGSCGEPSTSSQTPQKRSRFWEFLRKKPKPSPSTGKGTATSSNCKI